MVGQMQIRLGEPPAGVTYPIWAWYQWQDAKRRLPDLRCRAHLGKGEVGVRIEFTKPAGQILLSDFDLWHLPLCYRSYIGYNQADTQKVEEHMYCEFSNSRFGLFELDLIHIGNMEPGLLHRKTR